MEASVSNIRILPSLILVVLIYDVTFAWKEMIIVEQVDKPLLRYRRDADDPFGSPDVLKYDLLMRDIRVPLRLRKHHSSRPKMTIADKYGKQFVYDGDREGKKSYGMYIDSVTSAVIGVHCDEETGDCDLHGKFRIHKLQFKISPTRKPDTLHIVETIDELPFESMDPSKLVASTNIEDEQDNQEFLKNIEAALNYTMFMGPKHGSGRHRRQVPEGCNVIETAVVVDETVRDFHIALVGGDFNDAVMSMEMYYRVLFTEIDLRFCDLLDEECVRVYLTEVSVPALNSTVWTDGTIQENGGLNETSLRQGCRLFVRDGFAGFTEPFDYAMCLTRRDIWVLGSAEYRVFGFSNTLCNVNRPGPNTGMGEDLLDDGSLLLAHLIIFSFGVGNDVDEGCDDTENFVMSTFNRPPFDPATIENPWRFSNCTSAKIIERIAMFNNASDNCLLDNNFSDADFNAKLVDQPLAGEVYDVDFQCTYRFGLNTEACIGPGETSITDVDDICHIGVYCNVSGTCSSATRTRVLNGTPCGPNKVCFKNLCSDDPLDDVELCGNCTNSTQCPDNAICDVARNICLCMEGFSTNECGLCVENKELGENCSDGVDCADPCAVCDPKDKVCVCFGDTFDNNTAAVILGVCLPKVNNSEMCPQADACIDVNAFCNESNTCECLPGFVLDNNNMCVPPPTPDSICAPCFNNSDCTIPNTECTEADGGKICKCAPMFFLDMCGVCREKIKLGGDCSGNAMCEDPNAICTPDGICVCFGDTCDNNTAEVMGGTCIPKVPTGESCDQDECCLDIHAICNGTVCVCADGFKNNGSGVCKRLLDLCEPCEDAHDCGGENIECADDGKGVGQVCQCISTHFPDKCGDCQLKIPLDGNCSHNAMCADPKAVCGHDDICVCFKDTCDSNGVGNPGGMCIPKVPNGDPCDQDDCCLDVNAICNGTICVCKEGFVLSGSNECVPGNGTTPDPKTGLCDPCENNDDCDVNNTICKDLGATKECRCRDGYFVNKCGECQLQIKLGGNCTWDGICADPNAVCTPEGICECFGDTRDNNTAEIMGGTCVPKIPTGDPCENDDDCLDKHAICNGTICVCIEGFKNNGSGVCVPLLDLCDPCTDNHDCGGENTECRDDEKGNGRVCLCLKTHYTDKCGDCVEKIKLGGNCTWDGICADPNAVCTPEGICECFGDTRDNNTAEMMGGTCVPKVPTGDPCEDDDDCLDKHAICNGTVCVCIEGFKNNGSGVCVPLLDLCEPCEDAHDCGGENTECADDGKGLGQVCQCISTHFPDKCGDCQLKIPLDGNCSHNAMCADPKAVCGHDDICVCFKDTCDSNGVGNPGGMCIPKVPNGDPCDQDDCCLDVNAICNGTICVCKEGFVLSGSNECVPGNGTTPDPETGLCDLCENNDDCDVNNTICKDLGATKECRCKDGYFVNKCGECQLQIELGGNCTCNGECADENAVCSPGDICVCFGDFCDSNEDHPGGMCIPKMPNNGPCNKTDACLDVNAECIDGNCTCKDGFVLDDMNVCVPGGNGTADCPPDLCDPCTEDANCTIPNTECISGECRCKDGFFVDVCGECQPKVGLGSNCSMDSMCLDPQAVCDPENETCVCFGKFYDDNFCNVPGGECKPKLDVGEICTLPDSCCDKHAFCTLQSMCKCIDGFFPNEHLVCVPQLPLHSPCSDDDQCAGDNVECDDEDHECQCEPGFEENDCGDCEPEDDGGDLDIGIDDV